MKCSKVQFLMSLYIADDPDLTYRERTAFEKHLQNCQRCAKEYRESKLVVELAKKHWQISDDTLALIEKAAEPYKPKMTVEEGWRDLCRRCPDLVESTEKPKSLQPFLRIGAVAACLVIGVLTWIVFSIYLKPHNLPQTTSSGQIASVRKPFVKVELVKPSGNIAIATDQKIVSGNELKTLLINDKHQIVVNAGSFLSIEPLVAKAQIGCLVKLTAGEIYTHVEHDGNPFVVQTLNGKAFITGTTFDVKVTDKSTTLVVNDGTVQFESEKGAIEVTAGQTSQIVGLSAPSIPLSCNTAELTVWVTGHKAETALAKTELNTAPWNLPLSFGEKPIVLAETDYNHWVEQKREWFNKNFPWIFELKDALTKEGIEVDYPELLIKSGDVWQFIWPSTLPARFSMPNFDSLLKVTASYGFDKKWLLENVPAVKSVLQRQMPLRDTQTRLEAFDQWLKYTEGEGELPSPIYSYHAAKYLAETRSLIWFAIDAGKLKLTDEQRVDVLDLLQQEVTVVCNCQNEVLYIDNEPKSFCDEDACKTITAKIVEYINTMVVIEKRLMGHEITWK